jgi:hypothetical protein
MIKSRFIIWRLCLVQMITAVFFITGCGVSEPETQEEITSLTLMTWNIHFRKTTYCLIITNTDL